MKIHAYRTSVDGRKRIKMKTLTLYAPRESYSSFSRFAKSNMADELLVFLNSTSKFDCLFIALFNVKTETLQVRVLGACALCSTYVTTCVSNVFECFGVNSQNASNGSLDVNRAMRFR